MGQYVAGLKEFVTSLGAVGANLTISGPGLETVRMGCRPGAARVTFHTDAALAALGKRDHLALAEAYLRREIDLEGEWGEILKVTEVIAPDPTWRERLSLGLRFAFRDRRKLQRESIAFHYERPSSFFLPWFERWRSYSHGFYATPNDSAEAAQARKLQYAIDALGLKPGTHVFDMGCGWGSFLEFAGKQGIHVHGITISQEQHRFVSELISEKHLPCTVELVDFLDYRPQRRFDGAVFMGTFEHFSDYRRALAFLGEYLLPDARFYADFCTTRGTRQVGAFLAKYIWPGAATYVNVPKLLREVDRAGFSAHVLAEDTLSYAYTVRDWADALERVREEVAAAHGEESVRAFLLFLRASQYFFLHGRTQAYHLVAGRKPAALSWNIRMDTQANRVDCDVEEEGEKEPEECGPKPFVKTT